VLLPLFIARPGKTLKRASYSFGGVWLSRRVGFGKWMHEILNYYEQVGIQTRK
jgi:hypothetical protein